MLTLVANEPFKKDLPAKCKVNIDNDVHSYKDFVVVGFNRETETTDMFQNTDALTLGKAAVLTALAFRNALDTLSAEDRAMVVESLKGDE